MITAKASYIVDIPSLLAKSIGVAEGEFHPREREFEVHPSLQLMAIVFRQRNALLKLKIDVTCEKQGVILLVESRSGFILLDSR